VPDTAADEDRVAGDSDVAIAIAGAGDRDIANIEPVEPEPGSIAEAIAPGPIVALAALWPRPDAIVDEDGVAGDRNVPGAGSGDGDVTDVVGD
jgi:hypothetical protein